MIPNRIVLISNGRHDEAKAASDCYPGMAVIVNSSGEAIPHNNAGGGVRGGLRCIAKEDALQGFTIKQKLPSGYVMPFHRPVPGDLMLMLLQNGQNVGKGDSLMSAGDGTLIANPGEVLYQITAASTAVTNTNTETTFSNGSYSIPANFLKAGDVIHIKGRATVTGQNGTDTNRVRVYVGSTAIIDSTALNLAANSVVDFDARVTVRTIGATGTFVSSGYVGGGVIGTATEKTFDVESTTLDTTAAVALTVKDLQSAASTSNTTVLNELQVEIIRDGGLNTYAVADEAVDNSGGTGTSEFNSAAFIRVLIP